MNERKVLLLVGTLGACMLYEERVAKSQDWGAWDAIRFVTNPDQAVGYRGNSVMRVGSQAIKHDEAMEILLGQGNTEISNREVELARVQRMYLELAGS